MARRIIVQPSENAVRVPILEPDLHVRLYTDCAGVVQFQVRMGSNGDQWAAIGRIEPNGTFRVNTKESILQFGRLTLKLNDSVAQAALDRLAGG